MAELTNQEFFLELTFGNIFCKIWSPKCTSQDVPIVLIHDSLGCVEMWRDFPAKLAVKTSRKVIAYDRWGFGKSSERKDLPTKDFINEESNNYFPAIKEKLNLNNFVVFGHSVGGAMALSIASLYPKNCLAVITESAQAFVEDKTKKGILQAQNDFANNSSLISKLEKYHTRKTLWVLDAWIKVWLSDEFSNWNLQDILPLVQSATLIIHGDRDEYGTTQFPNMIFNLVQGSKEKQIIENCGHVPHREKPELILELVENFLSKKHNINYEF